jgi:hypothetical protein
MYDQGVRVETVPRSASPVMAGRLRPGNGTARGQALVETALVLPLLMLVMLAVLSIYFLDVQRRDMQQGVDVLADLAATDDDESWHSMAGEENDRHSCNADPLVPDVEYLDGHRDPGGRLLMTWHCTLVTNWIFDGTRVDVSAERVIPGLVPSATVSPSAPTPAATN